MTHSSPPRFFLSRKPILKRGDRGEAVAELQRRLRREDLDIAVDGAFGPATELALKVYQAGQRLKSDGIAGPLTWAQFEDSG